MTPTILNHPSLNHEARPDDVVIDMLVLHYTGMETASAALDRLCDRTAAVSAHYMVDEDGTVTRLVDEQQRAWHAGQSYWRGETNINDRSVGIELVNPGHEFGYRPFPDPQMSALIVLSKDILARHPIPAQNVVGHSDIAPDRKQDPGELFDWRRLADAGVGFWPKPASASAGGLDRMLATIGYDPAAQRSIEAFQRHFRPSLINNRPDEETAGLAAGLLSLIDSNI